MISQLAKDVRSALRQAFPNSLIKEEEYINYKGQRLFFDFYLPSHNLYVEVQGSQHEKFSGHFHEDKAAFKAAKRRDQLKVEWCDLNDFTLVRINHNEIPISPQDLLAKIREGQNG